MRIHFRVIPIILTGIRRKNDLQPGEEAKISIRVMPWDCANRKLANGGFQKFLPVARMDLIIRLGWLPLLHKYHWKPTLLNCHIKHILPVYRWEELYITSYLIQVSAKYVWIGHRFERNGETVCTAIMKLAAPTKDIMKSALIPPQGHFTEHISQHSLELFAFSDSKLANL